MKRRSQSHSASSSEDSTMSAENGPHWTLRGSAETRPGVASFPASPSDPLRKPSSEFVLVEAERGKASLKVEIRESADGAVVFVYPATAGVSEREQRCTVSEQTARQHRTYLLFRTAQGRWSLSGLVLGVGGILIDGSLKIGAAMAQPLMAISAQQHATLLAVATVLQLLGLGIVFARAFRRADF